MEIGVKYIKWMKVIHMNFRSYENNVEHIILVLNTVNFHISAPHKHIIPELVRASVTSTGHSNRN